jgi:cytochrome c553
MPRKFGWLFLLMAFGYSQFTLAGDAAAGQAKSALCAACHGATGTSANELWPNLAGQKEGYLIKQMKAFRDGVRSDPLMSPMSKALTDAEIENLAAFYASQSQ